MKLVKRTITISCDKQRVSMKAIINAILSLPGTQSVYPECEHCQKHEENAKLHKKLVDALKDRMLHCSCHYGGIGPDGFADQPCDECDRDRAIIDKYKD